MFLSINNLTLYVTSTWFSKQLLHRYHESIVRSRVNEKQKPNDLFDAPNAGVLFVRLGSCRSCLLDKREGFLGDYFG